jgi:hypothetical protein
MRIGCQVTYDGFLEILQPLLVEEHGFGQNSNTVFIAHGTKDVTTPSAIYRTVS